MSQIVKYIDPLKIAMSAYADSLSGKSRRALLNAGNTLYGLDENRKFIRILPCGKRETGSWSDAGFVPEKP